MAKASDRLAITHPVISRTISDLEHTLGVRLFDRSSQGVELTTYGHALLDCGVAVFDELRQGLKRIEFLADPSAGELRIGCPEVVIAGVLPAIAEQFMHKRPGVRLQVAHAETALLQFDDLRERKVDLLIGRMPRPFVEDDLAVEVLFDEPFVAVAAADSPWTRHRRIELSELIQEPWILPPYNSVPGSLIVEIFRAKGLEPPPARLVSLSVQLTAALIASGKFVGLLPGSVLHFGGRRLALKILPVKVPNQRTAVGIITMKKRTLNPLAELFINCAREISKQLAPRK